MATRNDRTTLTANTAAGLGPVGAAGGTYSIHVTNRATDSDATISVGLSNTTGFSNAGYLFENESLVAGGNLTYAPIVLDSADYVVVESNISNCNAILMGHDE